MNPKYTYDWLILRFHHAEERAKQLTVGTDEKRFLQPPAPGKWSAAACLNHLVEFGNVYYDTIDQGLEQAPVDAVSADTVFKPRYLWQWIIRFFEPPYRMKLRTIASFEPKAQQEYAQEEILESFLSLQKRFVDQLQRAREKGIDLGAQKVGNPVLPFIKMRLSECYAIAEAHQRRHLWQAEQTIKSLEKA